MGAHWPFDAGAWRDEITRLYRRRRAVLLAFAVHSATWLLSGVELWVMLRLMGSELGLAPAIVIDSLLNGLRGFAFAIPGALWVQEGGGIWRLAACSRCRRRWRWRCRCCGAGATSPTACLAFCCGRRSRGGGCGGRGLRRLEPQAHLWDQCAVLRRRRSCFFAANRGGGGG